MKVCLVGKYPPIEGGVSAQIYWAAYGLAERGHEIYVVTNADEVEEAFRIHLDDSDRLACQPEFAATGGFVRVIGAEHLSRRMSHIPLANPYVSKLAGLATHVVREAGCQVIVASYFEPYALAGHLAATWTGLPLLVQHAGSDLDRLMRIPELATVYKQVLRSADGVITIPSLVDRFTGMGVHSDAIRIGAPYPLPSAVFNPHAEPLNPADVGDLALGPPALPRPSRAFDPRLPTVGMYGKPGEVKGTYDLIVALSRLRGEGLQFNVLLMTGTSQSSAIRSAIVGGKLDDRTWVLRYLPHWKVPRFIRTCDAVCFLERDFPIGIHGPAVPREILACGTCLVLSEEILDKQPYRDRLEDGTNVVAVADPRDRADLVERLRPLIEQPDLAREIGTRGLVVSCDFADFEETVDAWEDLLIPFAGDAPDAAERAADPPRTVTECLEEALPWLGPVVGPSLEEWVGRFQQGRAPADPGDPGLAEGFCAFLESCVDHLAPPSGLTPGCLRDIVRYQRARLWATRDDIPAASPGARSGRAPVTNALAGREPSPASIRRLSPVVGPPLRIERFGHDVTAVFCRTEAEPDDPADAWASVLPALQPRNTLVCFARLPNLAPCEQRINDATERVVALCDGRRTSEEVARDLTRGRGNGDGPQAERTEEEVLALLLKLYAAGLVVFQEPPANVSDARPKLLATIGEGVR